MVKEQCRTEKVELTEVLLSSVRERSKAGEFQGAIVDWKDVKDLTFHLRARGASLSFLYRTRKKTVKVGDAWHMTASAARFGSALIDAALRRNGDPEKDLRILQEQLRNTSDEVDAFRSTLMRTDPSWNKGNVAGWAVADLRQAYLDKVLLDMRARSGSQVKSFLMSEDLNKLATKQVSQLDVRDLQDLLGEMERAGRAESRRWRTIQHVKSMLHWGASKQARDTGLQPQNDWWRWVAMDYKSGKNSNEPSLEDLVRTILVAEELADDPEDPVEPGLIGVLWTSILLCQRIGQIVAMEPSRLLVDERPNEYRYDRPEHGYEDRIRPQLGPEWRIYTWTPDEMKQALPHALPIPPQAIAIMLRYQSLDCPSYLFPRGAGDLPCYATAVNRLFYRMNGRASTGGYKRKPDRPGKPGPKPKASAERFNYMAAHKIAWWTPHDVRRSLTERLKRRKLGAAASAIQSHRSHEGSEEERGMQDVTRLHYAPGQDIELKAEGLERWVDLVLAAYEAEKKIYVRGTFQ